MSERARTLHLNSPDRTCAVAQALAPHLTAGDVILLSGPVGAGKSHFARCLILALLDTPEDVPSPTYTLVQTYPGRSGEIWHADLYRLTDVGEIEELGLIEAFEHAICLVEWPDRLHELAPETALHIALESPDQDDTRTMRLEWSAQDWDAKLKDIRND
ncbi:tRNA (adenosine(37)-N6)-threonylcarbamoyltransferase complex ATPase subunit type 1 TsaE [uncultured Roseovarius sp.]|uniref:tRNA (adenosine(37)-N6)-threonylcarbamoyltransferase complex ATPase subunit type 1 TsaE n=1 Tax=uncultured Roseovarius sp. TaxID=293344 RepID=UPI002595C5C9|nr:tRNA (adenosine(37)-N6)-threonylcarbamoyltransferase complex ATPase subunit type 1 TsaE [uncultured Roseovarius sp.]